MGESAAQTRGATTPPTRTCIELYTICTNFTGSAMMPATTPSGGAAFPADRGGGGTAFNTPYKTSRAYAASHVKATPRSVAGHPAVARAP